MTADEINIKQNYHHFRWLERLARPGTRKSWNGKRQQQKKESSKL